MALRNLPPYPMGNLNDWALKLVDYLINENRLDVEEGAAVLLEHAIEGNEKAITDGVVMYDPVIGLPIFSKNGAWYRFDGTPR